MIKQAFYKITTGLITIFLYFPLATIASLCDTISYGIDKILRKLRGL